MTNLEVVVVQLQDSCREARTEASELRQENNRISSAYETLKNESREREKYFRTIWHSRKTAGSEDPHLDDFPPPPPSYTSLAGQQSASSSSISTPVSAPHTHQLPYAPTGSDGLDPRMPYPPQESPVSMTSTAYHEGSAYGERSPSLPFIGQEGELSGQLNTLPTIQPTDLAKMGQYPMFTLPGAVRDTGWHTGVNQGGPSGNESVTAENGSAGHSPAFIPSPTVTSSEIPYGPRYALMDGTKPTMPPGMDTVSYMMPNNDRSISPTDSSPHNGSSSSLNSQFQFVFPPDGQERADPDYHRRAGAGAELTLHGGTADVSAYTMNRRRTNTGPDRPMLGGMPSLRPNEDQHHVVGDASKIVYDDSPRRARRNTGQSNAPSQHSSRSPSPSSQPPISSTLAVIKAQAFGALRRTRTRPKKASEGAAKMAMEVLEARAIGLGIGTGLGVKRPRLHDDEGLHS